MHTPRTQVSLKLLCTRGRQTAPGVAPAVCILRCTRNSRCDGGCIKAWCRGIIGSHCRPLKLHWSRVPDLHFNCAGILPEMGVLPAKGCRKGKLELEATRGRDKGGERGKGGDRACSDPGWNRADVWQRCVFDIAPSSRLHVASRASFLQA